MRRLAHIAALVLLGTALLVSGLHAATPSTDTKEGYTDNNNFTKIGGEDGSGLNREVRVFSNGSLSITDAQAPANMQLIAPSFMTTRFVYGADGVTGKWASPRAVTCDSTVLLAYTQGYNRLALFATVSFEDSVGAAMFAVQWRGAGTSGSSDSTNTFVLLPKRSVAAATQDTIGGFAGAFPSVIPGGTSASQWGSSGPDTSMLYQGEVPMVLTRTYNGSGVIIQVKNQDGSFFAPPYFGMRVRLMNTYFHADGSGTLQPIGNAGKAYGADVTVTGAGVCETCGGNSSAPIQYGKWVTIRFDLYGWRE